MPTLVLTNRPVTVLACGYDLRVVNLCRQARDDLHLVVAPVGDQIAVDPRVDRASVFCSVHELALSIAPNPSWVRHLRTNEADFLRLAYPKQFESAVERIREVARTTGARRMMVFGTNLAGLARAVGMRRVLFDVCDSPSLTARRHAAVADDRQNLRQWLRRGLQRWRWERTESRLPRWFNRVTTINDADSDTVRRLAGETAGRHVHTVPNGVGEHFLNVKPPAERHRGVVFWGNLPFPPNREAVRYFFDEIYLPLLAERHIEVCIVGRDPEPWLVELAARDPFVRLTGFVDDLAAEVGQYRVMINPMRSGSGMKNKVLEAFGLGLAVVSTSLGMEAFPDAEDGRDFLRADDPGLFAAAIVRLLDEAATRDALIANGRALLLARYRWEAIGERWNALLDQT